jgi:hypothetical protein
MINNWLKYSEKNDAKYVFKLVHITEKESPNENLIEFLQEKIITSYRSMEFYKFHLGDRATEDEIRQYIKDQIIPKDENQFDRNVRQGDWGEILSGLIVTYFQNLVIPINKLQWKFNKDKAVFGTDLIAFNNASKIEDIYYYEIKTRRNPNTKEGENPNRFYISIWAHNSLLKDKLSPTESIADFLERLYVEKGDYDTAAKFKDIVKNPQNYNKKFELFLIVEKDKYIEDILIELNSLPPQIAPLNVTIILIDNLENLVNKTWTDIEDVLVKKIQK